jgi:O-antigen/teichoic acid export membrane protein
MPPHSNALRRLLTQNILFRAAILPLAAAASLGVIRLTVQAHGEEGFACAALFAMLAFLLTPLLDLGKGGALAATFSRENTPETAVLKTESLVACFRSQVRVAALLAVSGVAVAAAGLWPVVLGTASTPLDHTNIAAAAALGLIALSLPLNLGGKVLLGVGLNHKATAATVIAPLAGLGICAIASALDWSLLPFALALPLGLVAQGTVQFVWALRHTGIPVGLLWRCRPTAAARRVVKASSRPMLAIMLASPLLFQTDRLLISHLSPRELAVLALGLQLYSPLYALISTGGLALWPHFAGARNGQHGGQEWLRATAALAALAAAFGGLLMALAPLGYEIASGGAVEPDHSLIAALAGLLLVVAIQLPAGMFLTRPEELGRQARLNWTAVAAKAVLAAALIPRWGATGAVLSTALAVLLVVWLPLALRIRALRIRPAEALSG